MKKHILTATILGLLAIGCGDNTTAQPPVEGPLTCTFKPSDYGIMDPIIGFKSYEIDGACVYLVTVEHDGAPVTVQLP